jgi:MFS family permease
MAEQKIKTYSYRWVVLAVFMAMMTVQQLLWITFATITSSAAAFYRVSDMSIGMLSMVFMIVYIVVSIPASWLIDTWGLRIAVGLGAVLTGIFGILRGIFGADYNIVIFFQFGIAVGQPLIINAVTMLAARWFPLEERATAAGLAWLAAYIGIIAGLVLTPFLSRAVGIPRMLFYYGIVSALAAVAFLILAKEFPPTPQCRPEEQERALVIDGLKRIVVKKDFILLMIVFFVGMGVFNGLATWIEDILKPRGFSSIQAGVIGGVMIISGILGSAVIPILSDKFRNRTVFILLAILGGIPGLIGMTFAVHYELVIASSAVLGFFILSTAPIGFQYGAEIAYPAPEGTSTGMLMMMGQISGIIFIFGMDAFRAPRTGAMTASMLFMVLLMAITVLVCSRLDESKMMKPGE